MTWTNYRVHSHFERPDFPKLGKQTKGITTRDGERNEGRTRLWVKRVKETLEKRKSGMY